MVPADALPQPVTGRHEGLAYALFPARGDGPASAGGVVVLHGAGSAKENHFDFARLCAEAGLSAVVFDQRGHGESAGALDGHAVEDVASIAQLLPDGPVGLRGSSMGGWLALASAQAVGAEAVVAICPAGSHLLREGLRNGRFSFEADRASLEHLLKRVELEVAAAALGERLLLLHAEEDEQVPVADSRRLHAAAPGSRIEVVPGGHHRSVQHDPELQALSVRFLAGRLSGAAARGAAVR